MPRRIVIEDASLKAPDVKPVEPRFDLQDGLLLGGVTFLEAGAAVIWWPAALLLAGLFCLFFAWLIQKAHGDSKS